MKRLSAPLLFLSIVLPASVPSTIHAQVNVSADPYTTSIGPVYGYQAQGSRVEYTSVIGYPPTLYYSFGGGLATPEDDGYATLSMPFSFRFFNQVIPAGNPVFVSANGFALFGTTSTSIVPTNLAKEPASFGNQPAIVPMYTDLIAREMQGGGSGLYAHIGGLAGDRVFTIEWSAMQHYNNQVPTQQISFQIKLFEASSDIAFHYKSTLFGTDADRGGMATVGIRDTTFSDPPDNVLQWGYLTNMKGGEGYFLGEDNFQILFSNLAAVPEPTSLAMIALAGCGTGVVYWRRRRAAKAGR